MTTTDRTGIVGEYHRSRTGAIHLAPCRSMRGATRWIYAEQKTLHEVAAEVTAIPHLWLCKHCWPAAALKES
jgi:hypothetical protein